MALVVPKCGFTGVSTGEEVSIFIPPQFHLPPLSVLVESLPHPPPLGGSPLPCPHAPRPARQPCHALGIVDCYSKMLQ